VNLNVTRNNVCVDVNLSPHTSVGIAAVGIAAVSR